MKHIKKLCRAFGCIMLAVVLLMSGCIQQQETPSKTIFEQALKLSLPNYTLSKYLDTHEGYNGEMYAKLEFDTLNSIELYSALTTNGNWKRLPINTLAYANVTWAGTLTPQSSVGKIPSDIKNGIWYFFDRSDRLYTSADRRFTTPSQSTEEHDVVEAKTCKNFTLAVYDIDNAVLYIYMYDEMPSGT